jgi:hypothetical protein
MIAVLLTVGILVVPGWSGLEDRDKSGTTTGAIRLIDQKMRENRTIREADRAGAERAGISRPVYRNPRKTPQIGRNSCRA